MTSLWARLRYDPFRLNSTHLNSTQLSTTQLFELDRIWRWDNALIYTESSLVAYLAQRIQWQVLLQPYLYAPSHIWFIAPPKRILGSRRVTVCSCRVNVTWYITRHAMSQVICNRDLLVCVCVYIYIYIYIFRLSYDIMKLVDNIASLPT